MFQRRMGRRAAFWGGELFVHRCAIARHSLLVVGRVAGSNHSPPVRRRGGQRNSLARRSGCFLHRALRDCAA